MIGGIWRRRGVSRALVRANSARDKGRWTQAAHQYRRYLRRRPNDFPIWVQLGHMLAESGDHQAAEQAYERAQALNARDADLALCRGHLRRRQGDNEGALTFYRLSFEIDGNDRAAEMIAHCNSGSEGERAAAEAAAEVERGGVIEGWYAREVSGALSPLDDEGCWVEFREGDRIVGRATPEHGEDGRVQFRAILDIDLGENGEGVEVVARRMPDGALLDPAPVLLFPPSRHPAGHPPAWTVPCDIVKPLTLSPGGEIALFLTHAPTGRIRPHVLPYLQALKQRDIGIVLIASVDRPVELPKELVALADAVIVRRNAGFDFGGWAHALKLLPQLYGAATLYLVNDSVLPATAGDRIGAVVDRLRQSGADLVGLTESHEWRWHAQSYFLAVRQRFLSSRAFHGLMNDLRLLSRKDHVIRAYEIRLAEIAEQSGHSVEILFPSPAAINPTLFDWRGLIARGFPFAKILLLRGEFDEADLAGWRETLEAAGFDLSLADAVLAAVAEKGPVDDGGRLLAHPMTPPAQAPGPPRVAFFGPWNYDNGLGQASRGIIGAIRRTGALLNLHPIKLPFHVHQPLSPPVDILDFEGKADVAIIHLNPDSWHLLTGDQRAAIDAAGRRIGYWVWEMGHLPPAWRRNFAVVDRIWAPSRYCADLFAGAGDAPVDVIPHVVTARAVDGEPADLRAGLGLPANRRIILYVFDGSSYLVRKNPAALVRAFSASGLARHGWSLVLKTKHLHDRAEEGRLFAALAEATNGVVLIDRRMAESELSRLMASADIYASPHCSEGFGLTIAEAMARGKPVVATDFGGSRDFLDNETGWPVRAHRWRLDQDFGHYTEGGEWARIDEPALTQALLDAAAAVEAGDTRRGDAGRRRVAETLNQEAIGAAVAASLTAVREGPARHGGLPIVSSLAAGVPIEIAGFGPGLDLITLAPDHVLDAPLPAELPTGTDEWIILAPRGTVLSPLFEREWRAASAARPDVDIFHGDDLAVGEMRALDQLRLKPSFDPILLAAQDQIGAPLIVRASLLAELGLRPEAGTALLDDLLFRAHHAGASIGRIAHVMLAYRGTRPCADPAVRRAMLARQPQFAGYEFRPGRAADSLAQFRNFAGDFPEVTLIIPTRRSKPAAGRTSYVERLLKAIGEVDWPLHRLSVIVGDDIGGEPDWAATSRGYRLCRIATPRPDGEPFNYAAKMNLLWRAASTELIVMMNDDLQPADPGWLKALIGFAIDESVGGVGARLLYADGRLQHAGIGPICGAVAHVWAGRETSCGTYQDWALVQRQWSMVTGALFATRRSLLEEIGGFDERFTLEYNDIDLCLRLRSLGYRIICTPEAEMVHAEKASRGEAPVKGDEYALFHQRWSRWLDEDPAWHPGLRRDGFEVMPADDPGAWYR